MNRNARYAWLTAAGLCAAFILAGGLTSCSSSDGGPGEGWTEDYAAALAEAKKTNRPILLDFTGSDWCGWCIKLHNNVFVTDEFKSWAADNVVLVAVDFPKNRELSAETKQQNETLRAKYGIRGYPTIVILDPSGEKELGRTGYAAKPSAFIDAVKKIIAK